MSLPVNWQNAAALTLAFFAFGMAALVSGRVFDRLPHLEDELAYNFQARIFARGEVTAPIPQYARAYWQPFIITSRETESRFGKYHPGWPALLAVGMRLGQAWVINAFCAMLTVSLVYRLGREIFSPHAGLVAAALTAFSPMALLLNGTLMPHTAALTITTAFMWFYWRTTVGRHPLRWAVAAGVALGLLLIIRPSTAAAVAFPFALWTALRLAPKIRQPHTLISAARPYVALALCALAFAPVLPAFNHATTGDASQNLYRLVWDYDRLGFGEGYGLNGHTISKGVRQARYDLSMMAADLFGFQLGSLTASDGQMHPVIARHLLTQQSYYPGIIGLSLFLVLGGVFVGLRRNRLLQVVFVVVMLWFGCLLITNTDVFLIREVGTPQPVLWAWLVGGLVLMLLPALWLAFRQQTSNQQAVWTWLLGMVSVALIYIHMAYWVGAQRYSTRYYFEALTALALLGALPLAWLIQRLNRAALTASLYIAFLALLVWGLYSYSTPRISILHQFNRVSAEAIDSVLARRVDDRPILVIAKGDNIVWRSYGSLMALTDPYLEAEIIVAWDYANLRDRFIEQHPDRQIIDIRFDREDAWFADCDSPHPPGCRINPPSRLD